MKIKIPDPVAQAIQRDPKLVEASLITLFITLVTIFFCAVLPIPGVFIAFMLIFFPIAFPISFAFGRLKKHALLKTIKEEEEEKQPIQKTKKNEGKGKSGKKLSSQEVTNRLMKTSRKSELEKSRDAHNISSKQKPLFEYVSDEDEEEEDDV